MGKQKKWFLEQGICQTLLASELYAFIVADSDSCIVFWNAGAEVLFGYPREQVLGQNLHELIVPEDVQERARDAFNYFCETGTGPLIDRVIEIDALHRDGNTFPVELALSANCIDEVWFSQAMVIGVGRRKEVEAEMKRLATTDPLTGVFNRENMFNHGRRELSRAIRYKHNLSLVLIEIDQLREINKKFGHYSGDAVIQTLTDFLKKNCRQSDIIGRLGSNEILLLLPETEVKPATDVAEKWRAGVEVLQVHVDKKLIQINCSFGVSSMEDEDKFEVVLNKVKSNLQEAKASGGNRVA